MGEVVLLRSGVVSEFPDVFFYCLDVSFLTVSLGCPVALRFESSLCVGSSLLQGRRSIPVGVAFVQCLVGLGLAGRC